MKNKIFIAAFLLLQIQFASAQTWQAKSNGSDAANRGIMWMAARDDASAYAIPADVNENGFYTNNNFMLTRDGGATWRTMIVPGLENRYLTCTEAASANTVYVIGQNTGYVTNDFYYGGGSKVMRSTDGGKTWVRKATNAYLDSTSSFADLIFFFNSNNGVMFGDPLNGSFEIYTTHNAGNSWSRVAASHIPSPLPNEYGVSFFGDRLGNTVWAGTDIFDNDFNLVGSRLLQSDNMGATWYVRNPSLPIADYDFVVRFRSLSVGLFKNSGKLYRTVDGGTTWNEVNYSGTYFNFCLDNVPGMPGTWISTEGNNNYPPNSIHKLGSSITYDDGDHWTTIDTAVDHTHVLMTSRTHGYSGGISSGSGNDGVFVYSPACGADLQVSSFTLINAASDAEKGALDDGAVIDLAQGSVNVRANLCSNSGVKSVRFRLNGREYRIENDAPYAIAGDKPTGDYNKWYVSPGTYTITAIPYSGSNGSGTAGVSRSITFTVINSGADKNDVAENMNPTVESSAMMLNAYPNPFNEQLTFEFSVPSDSQVSLELYNISGERVATVFEGKVVGGQINRQVFYADELASGLYMYRMKTTDNVITERVMLAR